jgi:transposase
MVFEFDVFIGLWFLNVSRMPPILLSPADRAALKEVIRRTNRPEGIRKYASIIVDLADGISPRQIAHGLHCSRVTVGKARKIFERGGAAMILAHDPGRGGRPKIADARRLRVIELASALPSVPIRTIAREVGVSVGSAAGMLKPRPRASRKAVK